MRAPLRQRLPAGPEETLLTPRSYQTASYAGSWEEIWEAGPYYKRIARILEDAKRYAIFAGWQIDSRLLLPGPGRPERLRDKLVRLCEEKPDFEFFILMWDHAYFYLTERELWQGRIWDDVHPRVHFVFDSRHPFGASHHEKVCIVDGDLALCGGIDLCDERWDSPAHLFHDRRRSLDGKREHHGPYHDLAVQVTGEICSHLQAHIGRRWRELSSLPFPAPPSFDPRERSHRVFLSRTLAEVDMPEAGPALVREVEFLFRDLIAAARKRILLEGQYYWSREINDMLVARMLELRGTGFEVVLVLAQIHKLKSLSRQMASYELELLEKLKEMASFTGTKLTLGTPYVLASDGSREAPKPVYIHSKVIVIDDRFLSIGSANLAARALRMDTEVNLTLEATTEEDRNHIREFGEKLLSHWHLTPESARPNFQLRSFRPKLELEHHPITTRLPVWQPIFDPQLPWLYYPKRRYRSVSRRRSGTVVLGATLAWTLGVILALLLSGTLWLPGAVLARSAGFVAVLASSWLFPISFFPVAVLAFLALPERAAIGVTLGSFWSATAVGYSVARVFPTAAAHYFRQTRPAWLPRQIGLRRFASVLLTLADPRISLRSKIIYQGLYCIPLPWLALGMGVLLPSAMAVGAAACARILPPGISHWVQPRAIPILGWVMALGLSKWTLRRWVREP